MATAAEIKTQEMETGRQPACLFLRLFSIWAESEGILRIPQLILPKTGHTDIPKGLAHLIPDPIK